MRCESANFIGACSGCTVCIKAGYRAAAHPVYQNTRKLLQTGRVHIGSMSDYPKKIIVLREAEKSVGNGDQGLSPVGRRRAEQMSEFVIRNFGMPDCIFATTPTRHSLRPLLTVLPLWRSLEGVPLYACVNPGTEMELCSSIVGVNQRGGKVGGDEYAGKSIVICLYREVIPMVMRSLGAGASDCPGQWPEDDFDSVYVLTRDNERMITTRYEMLF